MRSFPEAGTAQAEQGGRRGRTCSGGGSGVSGEMSGTRLAEAGAGLARPWEATSALWQWGAREGLRAEADAILWGVGEKDTSVGRQMS